MMHESEIRTRVLALLALRPDLDAPMLGRYTEFGADTCKHFIAGNKPPSPAMTANYERVLQQIASGDILPPPIGEVVHVTEPAKPRRPRRASRTFYVVETVRKVAEVLTYCAEAAKIGIITADFGCGKTESLHHWRTNAGREIDHLVFEFDEFTCRNICDFVSAFGNQVGVEMKGGMINGGSNFRAISAYLQEHPKLLIFDQCENVQPKICQAIRQWWDHSRNAGVGVVFLAAPLLLQRLKAGHTRDLGALTSRVGVWAQLRGVLREEAADILRQEGIKDVDDEALTLLFRLCGGSMRRLMAVIDLLAARHKGKPITERTIEGVAANLWGLDLVARGNA